MTQSDKDFITRIQVSQLVTQDPYADDFYAQVYGAILRSRMGLQSDERVLKFGSGGGVGLGLTSQKGYRRPSAMQRMEQQVERIVSNARKREEEKGLHCESSNYGQETHSECIIQLSIVFKALSGRLQVVATRLLPASCCRSRPRPAVLLSCLKLMRTFQRHQYLFPGKVALPRLPSLVVLPWAMPQM